MRKNFIGHYCCVIPHIYTFYANRRHLRKLNAYIMNNLRMTNLRDDNPSECICYGRIDSHQVKLDGTVRETLHLDLKLLPCESILVNMGSIHE